MAIKIPRTVIAEIISHALLEDPDECCGFLIGQGDEVTRLQRAKNIAREKRRRYSMDEMEVMQIQEGADANKEDLVAIYHSHTYMQAHPSETDVDNATSTGWTDPYYVVVSLVEKTRPIVRAFHIHPDKSVEEVIITTDGMAYTTANG